MILLFVKNDCKKTQTEIKLKLIFTSVNCNWNWNKIKNSNTTETGKAGSKLYWKWNWFKFWNWNHTAILLEIDILLSQSSDSYCSYHHTKENFQRNISNYPLFPPTILSNYGKIVNLSITTGTFPSTLKSSIISPLLKKPSLNKEDLSNYSPIANLFFISKLTEKIVDRKSVV